jgi:hypothetical protein
VQLHTRPVDFPPPRESAASQYRVGLIRFESGRVLVFHGGVFGCSSRMNGKPSSPVLRGLGASNGARPLDSNGANRVYWDYLWSRGVARWFRWSLSVADPFVCRCLTSSAMLPVPHLAHRTGRADLPHPALGEDSGKSPRLLPVTPSATSESNLGVVRLIANLPFSRRFLRPPSTEAPSLHWSYPASSVLRASPPSQSAQPVSHELLVDPYCDHRWDFPCCVWSTLLTCRR